MLELIYWVCLLFFACIGLLSIASYIRKRFLRSTGKNQAFTCLIITKDSEDTEYLIRSNLLKVDLGELPPGSLVLWNINGDREASEIALRFANRFDLPYVEKPEELERIMRQKLCLQT